MAISLSSFLKPTSSTQQTYAGVISDLLEQSPADQTLKDASAGLPLTFVSAATSTDGTQVILTYDKALDATNKAIPIQFVVTVGTVVNPVTAVAVNDRSVILTLTTPITSSQTVTVGYADLSSDNDVFSAIQDAAGNDALTLAATTPVINNTQLLVDTTAPAAPTIDVVDASDTGSSNTDNLSSDTTPTVRVTLNGTGAAAPVAGDTVTLLSGTTNVGTASISAANITAGFVEITAAALGADGSKSLNATVTDQAATPNTSGASPAISYTLDTTAPTASVTTASITVGTAVTTAQSNEAGTTYLVASNYDLVGKTQSNLDTSVATGAATKVAAIANTATTLPTAGLTAGTYKIVTVDAAGNVAASLSTGVITLVPDTTPDTTAPAAPSIDVIDASDTGSSSTDNLSSDTTPTVHVTLNGTGAAAPVAGDIVTLLSGTTSVGTASLTAANIIAGSVDITAAALGADGIKSLSATVTDQAATPHISTASAAISYTLDTTKPTASVTTATIANTGNASVQSNEVGTAYLIKDTVPVTDLASITGAADNQQNTVAITAANTATNLAAAGLADGNYKVYTVDAAGNLSDISISYLIVDTTAPAAPSIDVLPASDTGSSNTDNLSSDNTPTVRVNLTNGSIGDTVTLLSGTTSVGTASLTALNFADSFVDITATTLGADGVKSLTATIADQANPANVSVASAAISYTLDTTAPTTPMVTALSTNDTTPTIAGTATLNTGETLTVVVNGATYNNVVVNTGAWSIDTGTATVSSGTLGTFVAGQSYSVTATATDAAGNPSSDATANELTITASTGSQVPARPDLGGSAVVTLDTTGNDNLDGTQGTLLATNPIAITTVGDDRFVLEFDSGAKTVVDSNIEITGFQANDRLFFDDAAATSLTTPAGLDALGLYSFGDDGTNLYISTNDGQHFVSVKLIGVTGGTNSIDSFAELNTVLGQSVVEVG